MFKKFLPIQHGSLCARFLAIRQESTVEEYCDRFEEWSAPLPHLTEEVLENTFTNGLDPEIRTELFCLEPIGLENMTRVAQKIEYRLGVAKKLQDTQPNKFQRVNTVGQSTKYQPKHSYTTQTRSVTLAERVPFNRKEHHYRQFTDFEWQAKRDGVVAIVVTKSYKFFCVLTKRTKTKKWRMWKQATGEK